MKSKSVHVQAKASAPPSTVWALLIDGPSWTRWAGFDEVVYEREGTPAPHGLGAVRRIRIGSLRSTETVLAFEQERRFSYDYDGSLPFKSYRADVTLKPVNGDTLIDWRAQFTPKFPFTGAVLRTMVTKILTDVAAKLARAAESPQTVPWTRET